MAQLREKRLFLLDMDGTIYLDEQLFDGVTEFLRYVRRIGGQYLFLTNNSSRGVEGYIEKMHRLGIDTCREDYLTSVDATIRYLRVGLPGKTCYVAGTASFMDQLAQAGIPVTRDREQAEVLLCGFDTELTFQKLEDACILLNRGVPFIATNPDWVCPTWYGSVPDCGSVCRMLTTATGREPTFIGKPQPEMARLAMERTGFSPEQTVLLEKCKHDSAREQLVQVSMHYIRFLTEHPAFRRIVMQSFQDCDEEYRVLRGQMSIKTYEVVSRYCEEVQMPPDVRKRKTFIVRAIIYSAALFFDNGELEYNEKNMEQVRGLLEREFDLP